LSLVFRSKGPRKGSKKAAERRALEKERPLKVVLEKEGPPQGGLERRPAEKWV